MPPSSTCGHSWGTRHRAVLCFRDWGRGKALCTLCCLRLGCATWNQIIGVTGRCWAAVGRVPPAVLVLTVWPCSSLTPEFVWV